MTDNTPQPPPLVPTHAGGRMVFEIAVKTSALTLEVRVNDVPVMQVPGGHVETAFDINPHVVTGANMLAALVKPPAGSDEYPTGARCEVVLRVKSSPEATEAEERGALVFSAPEIESDTAFSGSRSPDGAEVAADVWPDDSAEGRLPVSLMTPFSPWGWMSADLLSDSQQIFDEVYDQTRRLFDLVRAKDTAALKQLSAEQARDWQQAYYLPDEESGAEMLGVEATLGDPDVEVVPLLDANELKLQVLGFGKLAHIVDREGKSAITLRVKGVPNMTGRFTALFCRRGGTWSMVR